MRTILFAGALLMGGSIYGQLVTTDQEITMNITGATTREDLAQAAQFLHERGVQFVYQPAFNHERKLMGISFELTGSNGTTGTASNDKLSMNGQSVQFKLTLTNDKWAVACTGKCTHK